jgi:superfamily II DNA/RNA helicase
MTQSVNQSDTLDTTTTSQDQTPSGKTSGVGFAQLGVPARIVEVLAAQGKETAFPIQKDTLPDTLAGKDVLGRGETGSGKTLAYSIPLVVRLGEGLRDGSIAPSDNAVRALILAPTRELVNQIDEVIKPLAATYNMKTTTIFGGVRYSKQINELRAGAQIVLACPGRLEDLLSQKALSLDAVDITILDEADLMADLGFLPSVNRLLKQIPEGGQHLFFSATLDHGIDTLVKRYLHDAKVHEIDAINAHVETMTQHVFEVKASDKPALIETLASGQGKRILFTRTKHQAEHLAEKLTKSGIPAAQLHGNLSQNQRDRNMAVFKSGAANVLVATDVAARGVDVPAVELVVQVDPPKEAKSFLHRSGRTARAGHSGDVVTLITPDQRRSTRRMLRQAAIKTSSLEVTSDSPEVLELVGPQAEYVSPKKLAAAMEDFTRELTKKRNASDRGNRSKRSERRHGHNDRYDRDRSGGRGGSNRNNHDDFRKDSRRNETRNDWHRDDSRRDDSRHEDSEYGNRKDRRAREFSDDRGYRGKSKFHDSERNERRDRHNDRSNNGNRRNDRYRDSERSERGERNDRYDHSERGNRSRGERGDYGTRGESRDYRKDRNHGERSFHDSERNEHSSSRSGFKRSNKKSSNPFSDQAKANNRRSNNRDFENSGKVRSKRGEKHAARHAQQRAQNGGNR